jgi:WD40 repeat protein
MGKSSLMIRTASRLRDDASCNVAVLDLAAVGQNLSPEQWYDGMLLRLGRQLGLEDEFDDFWLDHPRLSPVQRFFEALYQVVLLKKPGRFVVFIDELDTVRSLPFASDEFFAAIRQCFNERSQDPIWERLTFCLLGVATPSDLIKDPHISPFNIGRRIVLEDFKKDEVAKLVEGLEADDRGEILLERIFGWTNGHPYLTQRLCRAVAEQNRDDAAASVLQPGTIDGICHRLFLSNRAKERDDNLIFVRERLLRSDHDRAAVLDLYRKVRSGAPVVDDETNPLIGALHLSGVTQIDKGKLRVRNRIYRHVFSASWIQATMPDAEKRRQQEAYRRGVIRTTGLAFLVLVAMTYLAVTAYVQSQHAKTRLIAQNTDNGSRLLEEGENFDALAWFAENLKLAKEGSVSEELGRKRFASVLRHSPKLVEILPHEDAVRYLTFSPDGRLLLTASDDQFARVWNLISGELAYPPVAHGSSVISASFSPDGSRFVTASADQFARVFSTKSGEMIGVPMRHDYEVVQAVFSKDGQLVATASLDDTAKIWFTETGLPLSESLQHRSGVNHVSFSADGKYLVSASLDRTARVWRVAEGVSTAILELVHEESVTEAVFNPDGNLVATGSEDGWLRLWEIDSGDEIFSLQHPGSVSALDFSPDGHQLATACQDGLVRLLDVVNLQMVKVPLIHRDPLSSVRFSPAGDLLLSVTVGNEARVWDVETGAPVSPPFRHLDHIYHASFDETGRRVATAGADRLVKVWDLAGASARVNEWGEESLIQALAYSPDGSLLAYGMRNGNVIVRNKTSGQLILDGPLEHGGEVILTLFSPDSDRLLSAGFSGGAKLWDLTSGKVIHEFEHDDSINYALFNQMGNRLITTSRDRTAVIWNLETGKPTIPPVQHNYSVVNAGFSAGGREFATASLDNAVYVWNALSGELVRGPFRTGYTLGRPAFDDVGGRFVALVSANAARVFSLGDGHALSNEMVHRDSIRYLSFDQRGGRVVTTSDDQTARVWDAWGGDPLSPPLKHKGPVSYAEFSEDNHQLLTIGLDETAKLWSVKNGAPLTPPMEHSDHVSMGRLHGRTESLLTVSSNRIIQWGLEGDRRLKDVLVREAELLSGRSRDMTGELMGMSSTNLLESWSSLILTDPEIFSVDEEQKFRWHYDASVDARKRGEINIARFHLGVLERFVSEFEEDAQRIREELIAMETPPAYNVASNIDREKIESEYQGKLELRLRPRAKELGAELIDLSDHYNGLLEDSWQYTRYEANNLAGIVPGVHRLGGIDFDIRGLIQLDSRELSVRSNRRFEKRVNGIEIGVPCRKVHFLHAVAYRSGRGDVVGRYVFSFANGETWERPLQYGVDLADWWKVADQEEIEEGSQVVWSERTAPNRLVRLFVTSIDLPNADTMLDRIDLVGGDLDSAPFVIAITVE